MYIMYAHYQVLVLPQVYVYTGPSRGGVPGVTTPGPGPKGGPGWFKYEKIINYNYFEFEVNTRANRTYNWR